MGIVSEMLKHGPVNLKRFRKPEMAKLRPAGHIHPLDQFNPARQIPCTFFSSIKFPTVDSSATALAAACPFLTCLPQQLLAVSSAIKCKQNGVIYCDYCTTIHFNNLFLHRLRKSRCIRPSNGQAVANSSLGSKNLATPAGCFGCGRNNFTKVVQIRPTLFVLKT